MSSMSEPRLQKVTVNIGVGGGGQPLENARTLLERLTNCKPTVTHARKRHPAFKLRKGDDTGVKVTLRGKTAKEFLEKSLQTKDKELLERSFDDYGNVSFGVKEYIDFPGAKYDPKIGMIGFDVCVTIRKPGACVSKRRIAPSRVPRKHRVNAKESRSFMEKEFNVKVISNDSKV